MIKSTEVGQTGQCGDNVTVLVVLGPHFVIENVTTPNLRTEECPVLARWRSSKNVTLCHAQVIK